MQTYTAAPKPPVAPPKTVAETRTEELDALIARYSPLWQKRTRQYYIDTYNYYLRNYNHQNALSTVESCLRQDQQYKLAAEREAKLLESYKDYVPTNKDIEELLFYGACVIPLDKLNYSQYLSACCASVNSDNWRSCNHYLLDESRSEGNRILWGFKPPEPKMVEYFPEHLEIKDKDVGTLFLRWDYESPEGYKETDNTDDY